VFNDKNINSVPQKKQVGLIRVTTLWKHVSNRLCIVFLP